MLLTTSHQETTIIRGRQLLSRVTFETLCSMYIIPHIPQLSPRGLDLTGTHKHCDI